MAIQLNGIELSLKKVGTPKTLYTLFVLTPMILIIGMEGTLLLVWKMIME